MADIHILDLLKVKTQAEVGQIMDGRTQGAIHQMVKAGRDIYFKPCGDSYTWYEIKKQKNKAA